MGTVMTMTGMVATITDTPIRTATAITTTQRRRPLESTGMTGEALTAGGLIRLQAWLSPAFPVGSFSYSHGLESAVDARLIDDAAGLRTWLAALIGFGSGWNDAVLFGEAWRRARAGGNLGELADLGEALAGSRERHSETKLQGAAFRVAAINGWPHGIIDSLPDACPYAVAVGATAGAHGLPLEAALAVFLHAFVANLTQAAIRLGVTGQNGAVSTVSALEGDVVETAGRAVNSTLDDLGSAAIVSEIMSMKHETHYSRLFRS
jgi:urease accessory protein